MTNVFQAKEFSASYRGWETTFSDVKAAFAPILNLSSLIGLAQFFAYGQSRCILCRTVAFDVTERSLPAPVNN